MTEAILKNQNRILPCAVYLDGEYDIRGLFIGVLCKIGGNGLEKVIELKLNDEEKAGLENSKKHVLELVDALKKLDY